jgi:hypothetical protein
VGVCGSMSRFWPSVKRLFKAKSEGEELIINTLSLQFTRAPSQNSTCRATDGAGDGHEIASPCSGFDPPSVDSRQENHQVASPLVDRSKAALFMATIFFISLCSYLSAGKYANLVRPCPFTQRRK